MVSCSVENSTAATTVSWSNMSRSMRMSQVQVVNHVRQSDQQLVLYSRPTGRPFSSCLKVSAHCLLILPRFPEYLGLLHKLSSHVDWYGSLQDSILSMRIDSLSWPNPITCKMAANDNLQPSLAEEVDKELTCAICLCRYDHPKVLPCLHSYCKGCLEKLSQKAHPQKEIACPQCNEVHEIPPLGIDAFKTYFTINNLVELLRVHEATTPKENAKPALILCESGVDENSAVAHCLTCSDHLCDSCFEYHKKQKLSRDHNVVMLKDLHQLDRKTGVKSVRRKLYCEEHKDEPLKLFCKPCQKVICRDCALVKHREHKYVFVHECRSEAQQQLQELVKETKKRLVEFKGYNEHLAEVREYRSVVSLACKQELNTVFDQMVKSIEARRKALLKELEALSQSDEKILNAEADYLELALARFSNSIQFTEKLLDCEDDVEMMLMSTQAKPALESLQQLTWDKKKVQCKPMKVCFDQKVLTKCKSIGCLLHSLKDSDVVVSGLPEEMQESLNFSFEVRVAEEASQAGMDFSPLLSVRVTHDLSQGEEPVKTQDEGLNKWRVSCKPNKSGQHTVTVKIDTAVKVHHIRVTSRQLAVGMRVVRGPDWKYTDEDGGAGNVGEVQKVLPNNSKVNVKWPSGVTYEYRWGQDGKYDLKIVQ